MRSTATDRTCSAWALESTFKPVSAAGSKAWNGCIRIVLLVTGTTVTTPRPSLEAAALARSLLTTIAGRRLFASLPRVGSRSTSRTSPAALVSPSAVVASQAERSPDDSHSSQAAA